MGRRRENNLELPPHMQLKHGAYYFVGRDKKWIRLSDDKALALAKWAEIEGETPIPKDEPKPAKGSMAELIMRYMIEVAPRKAKSTYEGNKVEAENLKKVFGKMQARAIQPVHIAQYLDKRGVKSKVRANREISLLSHIFSMGMRWGMVTLNPCIGVAKHKEVGRDRYIMDNEFEGVKAIAGDFITAVMDFAYITALRKGDILRLKVEQITDAGIWVTQGKTGSKQIYMWSDGLREVIDHAMALKRPKSVYLFCTRQSQPYTDSGFKAIWQRVQLKWAAQGGNRFTFHDIRAKAITDANSKGMDAQLLAGHSSPAMTEHYIKQKEFKKVTPLK